MNDEKTDMFQIGRSSESVIDFIVLDTSIPTQSSFSQNATKPNSQQQQSNSNNNNNNQPLQNGGNQSTISRFSCRIHVDRDYPHTARIYAAGFDSSKRIFLGVTSKF